MLKKISVQRHKYLVRYIKLSNAKGVIVFEPPLPQDLLELEPEHKL